MTTLRKAAEKAAKVMGLFYPDLVCEASHHGKKDRHGIFEPCPIRARWRDAYDALRAALAEPDPAKSACVYPQCVSTTRTQCEAWALGACEERRA